MYCKGIKKDGGPCTCKTKKKYCNNHISKTGHYEDCPICYEEMQYKVDLSCSHSFCLPCLQIWTHGTCPICRDLTNHVIVETVKKIREIESGLVDVAKAVSKEKKREKAHKLMKTILSIHSYLFQPNYSFIKIFEDKIQELEADADFDTTKYKKALDSYYSRIKVNTLETF